MKILLMLAVLLLAWSPSLPATHLERGCIPAPDYMEVPHWVEEELCKPDGTEDGKVSAISIISRDEVGPIEYLAFFPTKTAAEEQDMDKWIGTAIFEIDMNGNRGRLILFRSADNRTYFAPRSIPGMEV